MSTEETTNNSTLRVFTNGIILKTNNRRVEIVDRNDDDDHFNGHNIVIKSLTSDTGAGPGVEHVLTCNDKIKESVIGLSEKGMQELYVALHSYYNYSAKTKININEQ